MSRTQEKRDVDVGQEGITIKQAIETIEKKRDSTVISYVSFDNPITLDDCLALDDNLRSVLPVGYNKIHRLDLFLHSPGGFLNAAYKYVRICRQYANEFHVMVPVHAKSAATAICLGADSIVMTAVAELGPLDPIIAHPYKKEIRVPARVIQDYFNFFKRISKTTDEPIVDDDTKRILASQLDPYLIGNYESELQSSKQIARLLLEQYSMKGKSDEEISKAVERLTTYYASHSFVIDRQLAADLGIKVVKPESRYDLDKDLRVLYRIYTAFMQENRVIKLQGTRDINRNVLATAPPSTESRTLSVGSGWSH